MEYYSVIKRKTLIYAIVWMNLKNMLQKKPDTKSHIWFNSIYMKHPEQIDWWGLGSGGMKRNCLTGKGFYLRLMKIF